MKYFKDILELILECLLFYEKIKIQGITCKKNMDLNRILKKCRIRHIFIVLVCKRYYN